MIIKTHSDLQILSTFGLRASSKYFLEFDNSSELLEISNFVNDLQLPTLSIGGGSNMIFCADYPGIIVKNLSQSIELDTKSKITVSSGYDLDSLVSWAIDRGLSGLEALSGIPGTVGGAIALNAGAYGQSISNSLLSVRVYDIASRKLHSFDTADLHYWHRSSIIREKRGNDWIILDATFKLHRKLQVPDHPKIISLPQKSLSTPDELRKSILELRKHMPNPYILRNSGSFFLNPTIPNNVGDKLQAQFPNIAMRQYDSRHKQVSTGWLLDTAGLKGQRIGKFYFHNSHANIVINESTSNNGRDLIEFIKQVQQTIFDKFAIHIVAEPLLVGEEYWQGLLTEPTIKNIVKSYP